MAGNALFLAPRETAEETDKTKLRIMVPNPDALLELADGEAEPKYDNIFVVRIDNANPASLRVTVWDVPIGSLTLQEHLAQSHLQLAGNAAYQLNGANTGRNLNLKFRTKHDGGALIVFLMADPNATFLETFIQGRPTHGIVRARDETNDVIFQARWLDRNGLDRDAISVILKPLPTDVMKREQAYGLGIKLATDDGPDGTIDIIIDPKVENEGQGL